jgi:hypothetical protein
MDYHLVDPLGDDEKDEQQSDVLDGCWSGGFWLKLGRPIGDDQEMDKTMKFLLKIYFLSSLLSILKLCVIMKNLDLFISDIMRLMAVMQSCR